MTRSGIDVLAVTGGTGTPVGPTFVTIFLIVFVLAGISVAVMYLRNRRK